MRRTGADQLVVVMKSGNSDGAKGLSYSVLFDGQPKNGRSLWIKQNHLIFPSMLSGKHI
jgi:hypothetical protein